MLFLEPTALFSRQRVGFQAAVLLAQGAQAETLVARSLQGG
jgi:hypothetical protein